MVEVYNLHVYIILELNLCLIENISFIFSSLFYSRKVQVGKDQEKAQSERDSHSKNRGGKITKLTIRYLYHETYHKPNE